MTAFFKRFICRLVILSSIVLPYSANTQAAMIGTGQAIANVEAQRAKVKDFVARADVQRKLAALGVGAAPAAERGKLTGFLARADVQKQLAVLGVAPAAAAERANALTDEEVQQLSGRIDSLSAGADISAAALLLVLIVILLLFMLDRRLAERLGCTTRRLPRMRTT